MHSLALLLAAPLAAANAPSAADARCRLATEAGPLKDALLAVSRACDVAVVARFDQIADVSAPALRGRFTPDEALRRLTGGTRFGFRKVGGAYLVEPATRLRRNAVRSAAPPPRRAPPPPRVEPIVVTGFRQANAAAIGAKRRSGAIVDGVDQDSIGLLPDLTIADAANRIVGLGAIPRSGTSTPRQIRDREVVTMRGLDPNLSQTLIDGVPFATAAIDDRSARLSLLPPTAIARIEAVKTLSANQDPHGIAGQIDLRTISALDVPQATAIRASLGDDSTRGARDRGGDSRVTAAHTRRLGPDDQIGLAVSGSWERFRSSTSDNRPGGEAGTYVFYREGTAESVDAFALSNGRAAPRRNQLYLIDNDRRRLSALARLDYRPASDFALTVLAAHFRENEKETRYEHLVSANPNRPPDDQTALTGHWAEGLVQTGTVNQPARTTMSLLRASFRGRLDAGLTIEANASFSRARLDVLMQMSKTSTPYSTDYAFAYDLASGAPVLDFDNPALAADPSRQKSLYIREIGDELEQRLVWLDASLGREVEAGSGRLRLRAGGALSRRRQAVDRTYVQGNVFDTTACGLADIRLCPAAGLAGFLRPARFATTDPDVGFLLLDDARLRRAWDGQGRPLTVDRSDLSLSSDHAIDERTGALWGDALWASDRLRVQGGVRYDVTTTAIAYYRLDRNLSANPAANQYRAARNALDYAVLLPSLAVRFEPAAGLVLRAGYFRSIARPNFAILNAGEEVGIPAEIPGGDGVPPGQALAIVRGNPDLRAMTSDNFDLAAEAYLDGGRSLVSAAIFYKRVHGLIHERTSIVEDYPFDGGLYRATIREPANAREASIYGAELALRKGFGNLLPGALAGLVFDGNLTWIGSRFDHADDQAASGHPGGWINQPEALANARLSWTRGRIGVNLAYHWIGEYLSNILSNKGDIHRVYSQPRGEIDLQARFDLGIGATLVAEIQNATKADIIFHRRLPSGDLLAAKADGGRVMWLGVNVKF